MKEKKKERNCASSHRICNWHTWVRSYKQGRVAFCQRKRLPKPTENFTFGGCTSFLHYLQLPVVDFQYSYVFFFFNLPSGSASVSFRFTNGEYFRRFAIIYSSQPFSPPYLTCNCSLVKMKFLAVVLMKNQFFWDAELCNAVNNFVLNCFSLDILTVVSFEMSVNTDKSRRRTIPKNSQLQLQSS